MALGFAGDAAQNSGRKKKRNGRKANQTSFKAGNPWRIQKGEVKNPGGRPKKTVLDDALKQLLEEDISQVLAPGGKMKIDPDMTVAQAAARAIVYHAVKGSARMAQLTAERTGGRPRQQIDLNVSATEQLAERLERARKAAIG